MNPHQKTALAAAFAAISTVIAASPADAVQLAADGRGEVLLYPYYTTRTDALGNAYTTLLSIINATGSAKAVRVRFLEGRNSREVLNFNLFLSPFDVWTSAILPDTSNGGAKLGTADLSCTLPAFSASPTAPFVGFVNFSYSGLNDDGAGAGLDRAREGYFEIIEMATYASSSTTGRAITHISGVPLCTIPGGATPANPFPPFPPTPITDGQAALDAMPPGGGLFGSATLINVNSGTDYSVDAVALANFHPLSSNYQPIGALLPDLTQTTPPVSSIHAPSGALYDSQWTAGSADAVSAVLMHDSLMNEYVLDTATKSQTDWVVTMPTKRFYVGAGAGNAGKLFQRNFNGAAGSCDDVVTQAFDREERVPDSPLTLPGQPPAVQPFCWTATVVSFNGSSMTSAVLGSLNVSYISMNSQNGWVSFAFPGGITGADPNVHSLINNGSTSISGRGQPTVNGNTTTYTGLPMIGFSAVSFTNGTVAVGSPPQSVLSNYGGTFVHKTTTTIR